MDILMFFSFILLTIYFFKWFLKRRENFRIFEKLGIPGPKQSFRFGNALDLIKLGKPGEVLCIQNYGPIFGFFLGSIPVIAIADPELLKIVQVKKAQIFNKRNAGIPGIAVPVKTLEESFVMFTGSEWKHNRDAVTPGYTTTKLKMLITTTNRSLEENWKEMREMIKSGKKFDMREFLTSAVANMTFQTAFGIKINDQKKLVQSLSYTFDTDLTNPINFLSICFPETGNFLYLLRNFTHKVRHFFSLSSTIFVLEMCKEAISARLSLGKSYYVDILQQMIDTSTMKNEVQQSIKNEKPEKNDEYKMSYKDCLANCFYAAVAKHDTVRNAVIFCTYYIAKYSEVQDKIRKEISKYNKKEESIDYTAISKMKYLDQVFSEVLRLFPTAASFINRIAEEDVEYNDILIPKGMTVYVPMYGLHRNPAYWSDPDEFKPERFEDKSFIDPFMYQPFGIGPRHCAGMRPGQILSKLLLANLVKNFKFSLCPETKELEPIYKYVITYSKHPIYINATPI